MVSVAEGYKPEPHPRITTKKRVRFALDEPEREGGEGGESAEEAQER